MTISLLQHNSSSQLSHCCSLICCISTLKKYMYTRTCIYIYTYIHVHVHVGLNDIHCPTTDLVATSVPTWMDRGFPMRMRAQCLLLSSISTLTSKEGEQGSWMKTVRVCAFCQLYTHGGIKQVTRFVYVTFCMKIIVHGTLAKLVTEEEI